MCSTRASWVLFSAIGFLWTGGCGSSGGSHTDTRPKDSSSTGGDSKIPDGGGDSARTDAPPTSLDTTPGADKTPDQPIKPVDARQDAPVIQNPDGGEEDAGPDGSLDLYPDSKPVLTLVEVCEDFGVKACDRLNACSSALVQRLYGGTSVCAQRYALSCITEVIAAGSNPNTDAIDECVQGFAAATCSDVLNNEVFVACFPTGKRPDETGCGASGHCISGYCQIDSDQPCGKCKPRSAENGMCDRTRADDRQCARGLACASSNVCVVPAPLDGACQDGTKPCEPLLSCVGGKCVAAGNANAVCATSEDCNTWTGFTCVGGLCKYTPLMAAGNACTDLGTACAAGAICGRTQQGAKQCIAAAADDKICGNQPDGGAGDAGVLIPGCILPARCLGGICKLPNPPACQPI